MGKKEGNETTPLLFNQRPRVVLGWADILPRLIQMHVRHVHFQGDPPKCNTLSSYYPPYESPRFPLSYRGLEW